MGARSEISIFALLVAAAAMASGARECTSTLDNQLLLAEESKIWTVSPDGRRREILANSPSAISLDYSFARNTLYWSDLTARQVFALKDKSTKPRVAIASRNNWLPFSIAVDELTDKIYVAEAFSGAIVAYDLSSDSSAVVLSGNLTDAKDIELDPYEGYLFVLDKYQILRTNADGSNPLVLYLEFGDLGEELGGIVRTEASLIYRKALAISDLTLDTRQKRVYWVNSLERTVESSDYEGRDRKVHFRDESGPAVEESLASVALLGGSIYWADDASQLVFKIDPSADGASEVILSDANPQHVRSVSCASHQQAKNPCAEASCEHLCLLSTGGGYSCACPVGDKLASDGRSCEAVRHFLLFSQNDYLRSKSLASNADAILPFQFDVGSGATFDYDAARAKVYHSASFPNEKLRESDLRSGESRVLEPDVISRDAVVAAYDWLAGNLYYFTYYYADSTTLNVLSVELPNNGSKIVVDDVRRLVRAAAVHPYRGYLYFAQYLDDRYGRVCRVNTDGSDLRVLIELGDGVLVEGLTLDLDEDRLYWSESRIDLNSYKVRHSNLDGEDIREVPLPADVKGPSEVAIHGEHLYAITDTQRNLVRFDKRNASSDSLAKLFESVDLNTLSGLKVYGGSVLQPAGYPCYRHDCEKLCFAVPRSGGVLTRVCGCPYGEKIGADGRTCVDNSEAEPAFKECEFTSFKCNRQTV